MVTNYSTDSSVLPLLETLVGSDQGSLRLHDHNQQSSLVVCVITVMYKCFQLLEMEMELCHQGEQKSYCYFSLLLPASHLLLSKLLHLAEKLDHFVLCFPVNWP